MLKFKLNKLGNFINENIIDYIAKYKGQTSNNIELTKDGLYYDDLENIFKIRKYLKIDIFQEEIYKINGKYIVIKDNESVKVKNITELDTTMLENTLLEKEYKDL
jgi:hypothetical protein